jgi:hypothetical protein
MILDVAGGIGSIVMGERMAYSYEVAETPRELKENQHQDGLNWTDRSEYIGDFVIFPYGDMNDMPDLIKKAVYNNSLAPGILTKKGQLLWGTGPRLYKEDYVDNEIVRLWQNDPEITAWLESWDADSYILECVTSFSHMQGAFTKFYQQRGVRIGKSFIAKLEHLSMDTTRLGALRNAKSKKPTHAIVSDFTFAGPQSLEYKAYNLFDFRDPHAYENAILYSNYKSFCSEYYSIPDLYGSLEWIRRSTAIPHILKSLSKNSINAKYHVISPAKYWEKKQAELQAACDKKGIPYEAIMLKNLEQETLKKISEVFSGEENTGKFWHTVNELYVDGNELISAGWEIKAIDAKVKDFIDAQIQIADRADRAVASGVGIHGALGNLSDKGESGSGSEQLYALKNYLATGISIPEMVVLKAINYAIKANFPGKDLKLGFYHMQPQKEQDVNPKDRLKNNV